MHRENDPYYDYDYGRQSSRTQHQQGYDQYNYENPQSSQTYPDYSQQSRYSDYPQSPQQSYPEQYPAPQPPPSYQSYPPPKTGSSILIPAIVIIIVLAIVLPIIGFVLLSSEDSSNGGSSDSNGYYDNGGTTGVSMSATKSDKNVYYQIDITKVSGGSLNLEDAKFILVTSTGTQLLDRHYTDASPPRVTDGDTTVYPISSSLYVYLNGTTTAPSNTQAPLTWEYCYFAFLDSESDKKINSGDAIWIYKDYNDDGTDEIKSGYRLKIRDGDGNEVLNKEL